MFETVRILETFCDNLAFIFFFLTWAVFFYFGLLLAALNFYSVVEIEHSWSQLVENAEQEGKIKYNEI